MKTIVTIFIVALFVLETGFFAYANWNPTVGGAIETCDIAIPILSGNLQTSENQTVDKWFRACCQDVVYCVIS